MISVVIPLYNEESNVRPLYERIVAALSKSGHSFEVIFVNDGSKDNTEAVLSELAQGDSRARVINFARNHGQTAAMMAGFDHASGTVIVPMDGDLQNDPEDILPLVAKLNEGFSVVSGWRQDRKDNTLRRNLPSRMANWLISRISGVRLHDYGCTLKAYRREVLQDVRLYGEMHRFVPIYAVWRGAKVTEMPVRHHARIKGHSKYGLERVFKVLLDLVVVKFLEDFHTKPIYVFGALALACFVASLVSGLYALHLKLAEGVSFILTPLPLLVVMSFIVGVLSVLLGLIAEMLVRVYYEAQGKPIYFIRSTLNIQDRT